MYHQSYHSPIGILSIYASDIGLTGLSIRRDELDYAEPDYGNTFTHLAVDQLTAYFRKELKQFDIPLDWSDKPPFHVSVWERLIHIQYGSVVSYQNIANQLDNPRACRAVGMANGKNPIAIIVPCHRVIGSDGSLTGYAYGTECKSWLLQHEGVPSVGHQSRLF